MIRNTYDLSVVIINTLNIIFNLWNKISPIKGNSIGKEKCRKCLIRYFSSRFPFEMIKSKIN